MGKTMSGGYETEVRITKLDNGIHVLSESVPYVDLVSVGMWVCVGSRHEAPSLRGMSHFIEHMLFKGTENRSARQIADEIDSIGGHLNGLTDKETTWYYAKVLSEYMPKAVEIIADMALHSVLDPVEIDHEKSVVVEEIKRHEDTPDDLVHDMVAESLWDGHPLSAPVIGSRKTVESFSREDIVGFMKEHYTPDRIVISAAGNLEHEAFVDVVNKYFGDMKGCGTTCEEQPIFTSASKKIVAKPVEQIHFCVGMPGYSQLDENRYALALLDAAIGGGMSSRLFQEIRENRGLAYAIGSYVAAYREGGILVIYGGTSREHFDEVVDLINKELKAVKTGGLGEDEMVRAKNQIKGALVLGQENMTNRMSRIANSMIYFGRVKTLQELIDSVMKVTADDLLRVADEVLSEDKTAFVAIGPSKWAKEVA